MSAALTGWALRSPLGATSAELSRRLFAGERAFAPNPRFDASSYACRLAAAIPGEPRPSRSRRFLRRMGLFAVEAALEAAEAAGLRGGERLGLYFGYGGLRAHWDELMPALARQLPGGEGLWERGFKLFHPFWMLQHLSNNAHALTAEALGARGEGLTFGGQNAGAQALAAAVRALEAGAVDAALVVAHDTLIEPETLVELAGRGAATEEGERPAAPYDEAARGFVPGEAAVALALAPPNAAGARARISAEDAADFDIEPGAGALRRAAALLAGGGEVVDGAARAGAALDTAEREALAPLVGGDAPLTATLSAAGQVGAAAPLLQAIALVEALSRGALPPVAGLVRAAPGPLRPLTAPEATRARAGLGLSTGAPGLIGVVRVELL